MKTTHRIVAIPIKHINECKEIFERSNDSNNSNMNVEWDMVPNLKKLFAAIVTRDYKIRYFIELAMAFENYKNNKRLLDSTSDEIQFYVSNLNSMFDDIVLNPFQSFV